MAILSVFSRFFGIHDEDFIVTFPRIQVAPVAYINESRTLSLNPVSYLSSGSANTLLTADC